MLKKSKRHESIHVEEKLHRKLVRISSTCLLFRRGDFGPAERTGSPVSGSSTMLIFEGRDLRGVRTIRPPSIMASSGSPERSPSLRRIGLGRTICPFVESLVSMVRQSCHRKSVSATVVCEGISWDAWDGESLLFERPHVAGARILLVAKPRRIWKWRTSRESKCHL